MSNARLILGLTGGGGVDWMPPPQVFYRFVFQAEFISAVALFSRSKAAMVTRYVVISSMRSGPVFIVFRNFFFWGGGWGDNTRKAPKSIRLAHSVALRHISKFLFCEKLKYISLIKPLIAAILAAILDYVMPPAAT